MAWHNTPTINHHALILNTKIETICDYCKILISRKYINPIDSSEADKVDTFLIVKFIFSTHAYTLKARAKSSR